MVKENERQNKKKQQCDLIDFYEVLGIEDKNISTSEIKKKYVKLAIKYHPDKNPDLDPQIFSLIQRAWECLKDTEKRKEYDFFLSNEQKAKKSDHLNLKKGFENFMDLNRDTFIDIEDEKVDEATKKRHKYEFDRAFEEMDKKNKFDRKKFEDTALNTKEASSRFNDLMLEREQQEIEFSQSRIFPEGTKFNDKTFNQVFDMYKSKTEKNDKLIKRKDGPSAWNNVFGDQSFTTLESFDKTYDENENEDVCGLNYGGINNFGNEVKIDIDFNKLNKLDGADYVSGHNYKDSNYKQELEKRMKERELESDLLNSNKFNDYDKHSDKSYMFTHEVGYVGNIAWDDDDDMAELQDACNKLIELERK